jgi:hypothetical protein
MTIQRTSAGLASAMFDELDSLKDGTSTPQQAKAKAAIANTIVTISRLEMEYARFVTNDRLQDNQLPNFPMGLQN